MKKKHIWFLGCGIIPLFLLFFIAMLFTAAGHFLIHRDPLKKVDVIVILSGGGDERLMYGAQLVDDGYARRIILTEPLVPNEEGGQKPTEASLNKLVAEYDITRTRINMTRDTVSSTFDEASEVLKLMKKKNWESLVIVTDSFHSRRTSMIFNHVFANTGIRLSVQPVDVPDYWYHPWFWWKDAKSRQATLLEYIKIIYFLAGRYE